MFKLEFTVKKRLTFHCRSNFSYNIEIESDVASHCATFACSEDNDKFGNTCGKSHTKNCHYCDSIPKLMMSISGAITYAALGGMDEETKEELLHELMLAHKSILSYKNHLLRAFCQNYFWDMMASEKNESIAFCTQGNL